MKEQQFILFYEVFRHYAIFRQKQVMLHQATLKEEILAEI